MQGPLPWPVRRRNSVKFRLARFLYRLTERLSGKAKRRGGSGRSHRPCRNCGNQAGRAQLSQSSPGRLRSCLYPWNPAPCARARLPCPSCRRGFGASDPGQGLLSPGQNISTGRHPCAQSAAYGGYARPSAPRCSMIFHFKTSVCLKICHKTAMGSCHARIDCVSGLDFRAFFRSAD